MECGHITQAIVVVPILIDHSRLNVAIVSLIFTPYVHCVVLSVLW